MNYLLEYNDIFEDEVQHFSNYLNGIGKKIIVKFCSNFISSSNNEESLAEIKKVIINWFSAPNSLLVNEIFKKIDNLNYKQISLFHNFNILKLYEYILKIDTDETVISNASFEVQLFKAMLALNHEFNSRDKIIFESLSDVPDEKKLPYLIFTGTFCYYDLESYNLTELVTSQFIKVSVLFVFLENYDDRTRLLLNNFCLNESVGNWKEYLKKYMPLFESILKSDKSKPIDLIVTKNDKFNENCKFLDQLISNNLFDIDDYDFITIRSKPFYKLNDGVYRIIVPLFTIEKMYNGLFFIFNNINKTISEDKKFKDFRGFYCNDYSERHFVYEILNKSFPKKFVKLSGQEIKGKVPNISAEPDYYIRNNNKILLFESKDVLIDKQTKQSNDYRKIESALKTKLYHYYVNEKLHEVGIMQLITNIRRLLKNDCKWDNFNSCTVYIYPILLLHHNIYNTMGLNYIVNSWFKVELEKLKNEGLNIEKVRDLVLVDINTFILFHESLQNRSIQLELLINYYYENAKTDKTFISFSSYAKTYIVKKIHWKVPELFSKLGVNLFD